MLEEARKNAEDARAKGKEWYDALPKVKADKFEKEPMEVEERTPAGFNWTSTCSSDEPGHELCGAVTLGELDPILGINPQLESIAVKTPLQALLVIFLMRSGVASSMSAAQNLVKTIVEGEAKFELILYSGRRGDQISTGNYPAEDDQKKALDVWVGNCDKARQALAKTKFELLAMEIPEGVAALPEAEKESWRTVFAQSAWAVEEVRARKIHKAERFISHQRVLLGDSSARKMAEYIEQSACIGDRGPVADVIRAFKPVVLSSRVKAVLVIVGRDSLVSGETVEAMCEQLKLLAGLCKRFRHVRTFWCFPPFVNVKRREFEALVEKMRAIEEQPAISMVATTATGRSALEIFRFGDSHNGYLIEEDGTLKNAGCRALKAWLYSQTAFPGDATLHIRSVHSVVAVPGGNRADSNPVVSHSVRVQAESRQNAGGKLQPARHHPYRPIQPLSGRPFAGPHRRDALPDSRPFRR
uniref:NB-ARC domain-containing protein n=1 Tax=Globodera pallida TaxID=36090 RepID=A0A183BIY1_GLOPA